MKNFFKLIKDVNSTPKGKALLFFGFYFIFFVVIILFIRFSSRIPVMQSEDYENGQVSYSFKIDNILKNNYVYSYVISLDGADYQYDGQRYKDMEMFQFNNKEYFRKEDEYFIKESLWIKGDNPYMFKEFFDVNNLGLLIDLASYEAKTTYESGKIKYNFLISSNTINQNIYKINSDFLEEPNEVIVSTDEEKNLNEVILDLDSYCKMNQLCQNSLKIKLKYDQFGEVEFNNPIE